jgi:holo-ACP synthase CitX
MQDKDYFFGCTPVTLEQVLQVRERRAVRQKELAVKYTQPVITIKLNIPGEIKSYPLAEQAFSEALAVIFRQLTRNGIKYEYIEEPQTVTGFEGFVCADSEPAILKNLMMEIEDRHPLGRLFDFDVIDETGTILPGSTFGREERTCLLCENPVWVCARSRKHSAEELASETARRIDRFFTNAFTEKVAKTALRALLYEASITPKPGLVDRCNSGAHKDMDFFTFVDSAGALVFFFKKMAQAGVNHFGLPETLLPCLRFDGQEAESIMRKITGGVNTHKGAIFSLGILCASCGILYRDGQKPNEDTLALTCGKIAGSIKHDFEDTIFPSTHGMDAFASYAITGARGEAAAGFPCVFKHAFPHLRILYKNGASLNDAGAAALIMLISIVNDTNIIHRKGIEVLRRIQAEAADMIVQYPGSPIPAIILHQLDNHYISHNISPGGSADMLALCFFLLFLTD